MARSSKALIAARLAVVLVVAGMFSSIVFGAKPSITSSERLRNQLQTEQLQALLTEFDGTGTLDEILFDNYSEIRRTAVRDKASGNIEYVSPKEDIIKVLSYECAGNLFGDTPFCQEYLKIPAIVEAKAAALEKSGWHKKAFYASLATLLAGIGTIIAYAYSDGYFKKQQNKSEVS